MERLSLITGEKVHPEEEICLVVETLNHNTRIFGEEGDFKESTRSLVFEIVSFKGHVILVNQPVFSSEDLESYVTAAAASYNRLLEKSFCRVHSELVLLNVMSSQMALSHPEISSGG